MQKTWKNNLKVGLATLILVRRTHAEGMEFAAVDGLSERHMSRRVRTLRHA
jgi:uncharacterized protein (DUF2237 family)